MSIKLDKESYEKHFKDFFITDCVVRAKDLIYICLEQENDDAHPVTRVVICDMQPNGQTWSKVVLSGMRRMNAGVSLKPKAQFVGVSYDRHAYAIGSGEKGLESDLPSAGRGPILKLRTIDGHLYGCGLGRFVFSRVGRENWHYHTTLPNSLSAMDPTGFNDIDGFSSNDIYAAGHQGDVWHFDGRQWQQIPFPSNMDLDTVCCAPDGSVYIGAESGNVFKGRNNKWKLISRGDLALPFKDMVWHNGAVWCTSDYGLWTITDDKLTPANVPAGISVCAGNLSVGDGVMLLAGSYGAALHNGKEWHRIIDYNDFP